MERIKPRRKRVIDSQGESPFGRFWLCLSTYPQFWYFFTWTDWESDSQSTKQNHLNHLTALAQILIQAI